MSYLSVAPLQESLNFGKIPWRRSQGPFATASTSPTSPNHRIFTSFNLKQPELPLFDPIVLIWWMLLRIWGGQGGRQGGGQDGKQEAWPKGPYWGYGGGIDSRAWAGRMEAERAPARPDIIIIINKWPSLDGNGEENKILKNRLFLWGHESCQRTGPLAGVGKGIKGGQTCKEVRGMRLNWWATLGNCGQLWRTVGNGGQC